MKCPACWREKYIERVEGDPTINMIFGRAMSEALQCLHNGGDAVTCFARAWSRQAHVAEKLGAIVSAGVLPTADLGIMFLKQYQDGGIYSGTPEKQFEVRIKQLPLPVLGYFDLQEENGRGKPLGIVEFKTTTAKWDQQRVDTEFQGTVYWCAYWTLYRELPHLTYVVMDLNDQTVKRFETRRTREQCLQFLETVNQVYRQMKLAHGPGGVFPGFCERHRIRTMTRSRDGEPKLILER